jgi:class 3 adenylate cyclase
MDRLVAMARGEELPEHANGAALFADISGFSTLATRLERTAGPALAVERLSTVVDGVFGLLVRELHRAGGAAICFAGDAVTGWFDDRPEAAGLARAEACARAIQDGVAAEAEHGIALRIGVAAGPARRLLLGDPAVQLLDAVAGRTVARAVAAQDRAEPGETVIDEARAGAAEAAAASMPASGWPDPSTLAVAPGELAGWQHAPVLEHLQSGAPLLADLRRVAVLFARCPPLDFDAEPGAGATLDAITRHAQHALTDVGGTLLHVVVGDKGSYVVGAVGAPLAQPDHSRRAARAARALHAAVPGELAIGVAEGRAWAGLVGTAEQSCYTLLGGVINRAARLMGHAPPGETYVSPRLARALTGAFTLREAGRVTLKGDLEPVVLTAVGDEVSGPVAASSTACSPPSPRAATAGAAGPPCAPLPAWASRACSTRWPSGPATASWSCASRGAPPIG